MTWNTNEALSERCSPGLERIERIDIQPREYPRVALTRSSVSIVALPHMLSLVSTCAPNLLTNPIRQRRKLQKFLPTATRSCTVLEAPRKPPAESPARARTHASMIFAGLLDAIPPKTREIQSRNASDYRTNSTRSAHTGGGMTPGQCMRLAELRLLPS